MIEKTDDIIKSIYIKNKKLITCTATAVLVTVLLIMIFVIFRVTGYREILELARIEEIDADWFVVEVVSYDSKTMDWIAHRASSRKKIKKDTEHVYELAETRGKRTRHWDKDMIEYPVYAITITPREADRGYDEIGETFVWTDGYLITSTGNVYICDLDIEYFLKADEDDFHRSAEVDRISDMSCFRALSYAAHGWNTDTLPESLVTDDKMADSIDATLTGIDEIDDFTYVRIRLINNSDSDWHYCDSSIFVRIEVKVDGVWYFFHKDPGIDLSYTTFPTYTAVVGKRCEEEVQFNLGMYGDLPEGDYRVVIGGKDGEKYDYACADFCIKSK